MKRQGGVAEKAPQQVATPGEATALEADVVPDVVDGVRGEVRQATVLERAPQFLDRVEFRRVRRKPDGVPSWMGPATGVAFNNQWSGVRAPRL